MEINDNGMNGIARKQKMEFVKRRKCKMMEGGKCNKITIKKLKGSEILIRLNKIAKGRETNT